MSERLSLICPIYNEGANADTLLEQIAASVHVPCEIVFVYDFDEDNTLPVIRARVDAGYPLPVRLVKNSYGRGALNAVKTGLESGSGSLAEAVIMADLSDDLPQIDGMFARIKDGWDIVCASRYMRGGRQLGGPPLKSFLSRAAGLSLHYLAGIPTHDSTNNFKMYRGSFIRDVPIESTGGFELALELVVKAKANGYRICEVPATWHDRLAGESKFDLQRWLPHYLKWYWLALIRSRRLMHR